MAIAGLFIAYGAMKFIVKIITQCTTVKLVNAYLASPATHHSYALAQPAPVARKALNTSGL